ncbi:MAG: alcohol dehydrogenase catalytic domain-containing protein, partial [Solirubrobacterales bacterium]|nr:alcohol dehydrogenase catalytic domain-containing protein [Solirubrobacterales bacterium]
MRYIEIDAGAARLRDGPEPETLPGYARVRVLACGVCGTDLHLLRGMVLPRGASYPVRPGHEVAGIVEHVNASDALVAEGDLAVLHPLAPCGSCPACRRGEDQRCDALRTLGVHDPGGFADIVVWPASRMLPANGIDPAAAALLADAAATAHNALALAAVPPGGSVCVLGAGGLGTGALEVARALDPQVRLSAVVRSEASAA